MKRILITGAGGFIGSHLAEHCVAEGYRVKAFVRYNSSSHSGWLETSPFRKEMDVLRGDIRDFDSVSRALEGCDTVYHLAALIGIPYSYHSPLAYIRTNVEGTYNVLEAARISGTEQVLVTSTSETYGTAQKLPISEQHPLVGQSPYSASKIAADQLAISYHRSFALNLKIVRPFNTYGPRQSARAIIPTVVTQLLQGAEEIKLGNLEPTRDLTFVHDTIRGIFAIQKTENLIGQVTNIGMNEEISVKDLTMLIASLIGKEARIAVDQERMRPKMSEVDRLRCDNTKLRENSGWEPHYDLRRGLLETIQWIEQNLDLYKSSTYTI